MNVSDSLLKRIAVYGLVIFFTLSVCFHLLVVSGIIPYTIVWGGKITGTSQMYVLETVSLTLNIIFLFVVILRSGIIKNTFPSRFFNISLWLMFILFFLNTIGNLFSENTLEKTIFTPITVLIAFFCSILIFKK